MPCINVQPCVFSMVYHFSRRPHGPGGDLPPMLRLYQFCSSVLAAVVQTLALLRLGGVNIVQEMTSICASPLNHCRNIARYNIPIGINTEWDGQPVGVDRHWLVHATIVPSYMQYACPCRRNAHNIALVVVIGIVSCSPTRETPPSATVTAMAFCCGCRRLARRQTSEHARLGLASLGSFRPYLHF